MKFAPRKLDAMAVIMDFSPQLNIYAIRGAKTRLESPRIGKPVQGALESAPKQMDETSPYGLQPLNCKKPGY